MMPLKILKSSSLSVCTTLSRKDSNGLTVAEHNLESIAHGHTIHICLVACYGRNTGFPADVHDSVYQTEEEPVGALSAKLSRAKN